MLKKVLFINFLILFFISGLTQTLLARRPLSISDFYKIKTARTPAISPDGKSVLFVINQMDSASNGYHNQIWLTALAGGKPEQLTFMGTSNHSPVWSPDGKSLVYISNAEGTSQLWLMNLLTRESQRLTDLPQGVWQPVWSPDGRKISFLSETKFEGRNPQGLYDIKVLTHLRYRWWYDDNRYDEGWRSHIFIIDLATKEIRQLTDATGLMMISVFRRMANLSPSFPIERKIGRIISIPISGSCQWKTGQLKRRLKTLVPTTRLPGLRMANI